MSIEARRLMEEISDKLTELESEWNASAPNHLPRSGGAVQPVRPHDWNPHRGVP